MVLFVLVNHCIFNVVCSCMYLSEYLLGEILHKHLKPRVQAECFTLSAELHLVDDPWLLVAWFTRQIPVLCHLLLHFKESILILIMLYMCGFRK